ncbi:MAG: glycosyltransferase [Candidatus Methylomirabilis oxyfera]|nr:glycosyltransferase [Candidatus Methylomirabilis oxyfera]
MNLGIVTPQLSDYGGSEIYLLECVKRWQKELEITLYTPSPNRKLLKEFGITDRVRIISLQSKRRGKYAFFFNTVILPHIWEEKILSHDLYFLYLFPTHFIQRRPSIWFAAEPLRTLYDLRHHDHHKDKEISFHFYPELQYNRLKVSELDVLLHLIERFDSVPTFDRLAANSQATGRYLHTVYGRKPDRIVYPGVNLPGSTSPPPPSRQILFVGRLLKHKRVDLIIRALSLLPRGELVVAGEGPEKPHLRKLARDLGLSKRVKFAGQVTQKRLEELYARSSLCVYTPIREPFGIVPLEAAAAGRPVVATEGGGYCEILDDSCAFFVPADPAEIAKGVQTLLDDRHLARKMGEAGRKTAGRYTWDRTAASLLDLFRETTRNGGGQKKTRHKTLLGAHYYPWYRAGKDPEHWNENQEFAAVIDFPTAGPYSSGDGRLIRRHLRMAMDAGLDFLVVNWQVTFQGLNPTELEATRKLFETVSENGYPISLALLLAIDTEDPQVIKAALSTARKEFVPSPAYLKFQNQPVIWYYLSYPFLGHLFQHHRDLMRLNRGCHPVATGPLGYHKFLPRLLKDFFSGWCLYSPLQVGPKRMRESILKETYRDVVEDGGRIRVFTVCPGYDDSRLTSAQRKESKYRVIDRKGTHTYQKMQKIALELTPAPDFVVVTSFNEFHENTHIEPSAAFGDVYLKETRAFKRAMAAVKP